MIERKTTENQGIHTSLDKNEYDSFLKITKLNSSDLMKKNIELDERLSGLVKTYFKNYNEKVLSTYSEYWVNMSSLQQSLVDYKYDLWNFWVNKNWVDGDFGINTFIAIINIQKAMWQEPTGILNLDLLKFLFPRTFRSHNKREWRTENDTQRYVKDRISDYNELSAKKEEQVQKPTRIRIVWLRKHIPQTDNLIHPKIYKKTIIKPRIRPRTIKTNQTNQPQITEQNQSILSKTAKRRPRKLNEAISRKSSMLAKFLMQKWYPNYVWWVNCWANVWEALLDFWMRWLPTWWRDWYKWGRILERNTLFVKRKISHPSEALPGWILVYDKWYWPKYNSKWKKNPRYDYGHAEIKTFDWYWYWTGPKKRPGWSTLAWFTGYVYYPKDA